MGNPSRRVPHFQVQALPDEKQWNQLLARFPRILRELTLTSVWDTLCFKPLCYAEAVTQPLRIVHGDAVTAPAASLITVRAPTPGGG